MFSSSFGKFSVKSIKPIVVPDSKNFYFGKEIICNKFSPIEDYFPVKTKKVEFLINRRKIIKFVLTQANGEIVAFELFIQVLGLQEVFYVHNWVLRFHHKHRPYKIHRRFVAMSSCGFCVKFFRGTQGRVLCK